MITHATYEWETRDGIKLFAQSWLPETGMEELILLAHGHGEHSGRFEHLAKWMCKHGVGVVALDLRGHGKSEGKRGHTPSYEALMDDLALFVEKGKEIAKDIPVFLYGHSMGGNLVLNYGIRRKPDVRGLIISSPWLKLAFDPPSFRLKVGKLMNKIAPGYTENSTLDSAKLSRDPEVGKKYDADPLVHGKISTRLFFGIHDSGLYALENAAKLELPTYHMHGTGDQITSFEASKQFVAGVSNDHYNFHSWQDGYHELHNEPNKESVYESIHHWIRMFDDKLFL